MSTGLCTEPYPAWGQTYPLWVHRGGPVGGERVATRDAMPRCRECHGFGWIYVSAVEYGEPEPAHWEPCVCNPRRLGDPGLGIGADDVREGRVPRPTPSEAAKHGDQIPF